MRRTLSRHRAWTTTPLVLLAGCLSLDTGPGLSIDSSVVAAGEALLEQATATASSTSVVVSGRIVGRLPCDNVDGRISESGDELRLIVVLESGVNACNGIPPTTFSYVANIVNVERGSLSVVVEHRFRGTDGVNRVVLNTVVDVG